MTREERTKLIRHLKYNRSIGADYLITDKDADEIIKALEQQPCEDCVRELIREFDHKHPTLFADYMQEFNSHPISEIIEYMWNMHELIEDIKYRLPNEGGDDE